MSGSAQIKTTPVDFDEPSDVGWHPGPASIIDSVRARVLIADDDEVVRHRLAALIEGDPSLNLVAIATDVEEAIAMAAIYMPDIVILDWVMPGGGGPKAASEISRRLEGSRIVGISAHNDLEASYDMIRSGAIGFLKKTSTREEILQTLHHALAW